MKLIPLLAALLALTIPASAQEVSSPEVPPGSVLLLSDDAGDVSGVVALPLSQETVDLLFLSILELPRDVEIYVGLAALWSCNEICVDASHVVVEFDHGGKSYAVQGGRDIEKSFYAGLYEQTPEGSYLVEGVDIRTEPDFDAVVFSVPSALVPDESGAPPRHGHDFSNVTVRTESRGFLVVPNTSGGWEQPLLSDTMGAEQPGRYSFVYGAQVAHGPLQFTSPTTFRETNGEATTLRYEAEVTNLDATAQTYKASVSRSPANWEIEIPSDAFTIPGSGRATMPILAISSGAHQHGAFDTFNVDVTSLDGAAHARLEFGVHYLKVPQPSGHHPTVFLHTWAVKAPFGEANKVLGGTNGGLYMNTLEEDLEDARVAVIGTRMGDLTPMGTTYRWFACLAPQLDIGLDGTPGLAGKLELELSSTQPVTDVALSASLLWLTPGEPIASCFPSQFEPRIGRILATGETSVGSVSSPSPAALEMKFGAEADYVPYQQGAGLVLTIEARHAPPIVSGLGIHLEPGAQLTMPWMEYADSVPVGAAEGALHVAGAVPVVEPADSRGLPAAPFATVAIALLGAFLVAGGRRR